ncbi:MAG: glycoside hydrolase family 38 C-terminal domain-containing protein, partial [Chloroflexota bacterium]|nr:glycoside hydrolase family 38 C-terminal domain-containing protein [Chloroflexota bacterium]
MDIKRLHMIGNAHIDPVWLWNWQEGFHEVKATFRSALDRMKEFDDFIFVSSSAVFYHWVEQSDPELFTEITQRIEEGRWVIVGGWWIEPDCNIPSGESFVRQGLYGQRYFRSRFGKTAKTGFNVDSFGHNGGLPQILKKSGLDYYTFLRPMPHERGLPSRLFWWESDDGSRVLAFRIAYEYLSWGKNLEKHALRCAQEMKDPMDEFMCYYGVGNHGGGPTIENLQSIHSLNEEEDFPAELICSSPDAFFETVLKKDWQIPVVHDELQNHAKGCYAGHSGIKQWNRKAENKMMAAEKWSVLADYVNQQEYPTDFAHAWKQVLFNQFHDILAGTSLESAYEDARNLYGEAIAIADRNFNLAVQSFAWKIAVPENDKIQPLVVFNPLTWPVENNVEIEANKLKPGTVLLDEQDAIIPLQEVQSRTVTSRTRLSFMAEVPALGYRTYRLVTLSEEDRNCPEYPKVEATDQTLENERFRMEFDPKTGCIASLRDKEEDIEIFSSQAAKAVVLDDPSDTWGHNITRWDKVVGQFEADQISLVEHGPVKSVIRVTSTYDSSSLIQEFAMYPNRNQIDVRVIVDWHEQFKMLKIRFPINVKFMTVTRDIAYGNIETFANGEEQPFQKWVDVSGTSRDREVLYGFSLLNDAKYSLDVNVRDIGMTVLRSPAYANHMPAKLDPEGLYPIMDQGIQTFHYTMLPHIGSWETAGTPRMAEVLNQPLFTMFGTSHPDGDLPMVGSFIKVAPENIMATVLKQAEDNDDLILRAVEVNKCHSDARFELPFINRTIDAEFK